MATKKIEIQDSNGNVYYPHTDASVVKNGSKTVAEQLNEITNPNLLINGDFLINQRGQTQYNKNYKYTVDRWCLSNMNKDLITEKGVLNVYDGFVELTGMGDYQLYIQQASNEVEQLQNKTVTFSVDARVENMSKGNIFVQFSYKYNSNQSGLGKKTFDNTQLNGEWKRISVTLTIPNYKLNQFWAQCGSFSDPDNGYLPVNTECKIQFRNAKLEIGEKATPFIPRLHGEEITLCKRYYQNNPSNVWFQFSRSQGGGLRCDIPVGPMRVIPTLIFPNNYVEIYNDASQWVQIPKENCMISGNYASQITLMIDTKDAIGLSDFRTFIARNIPSFDSELY